jgi:hypothetical protein
MQNEQTSHGVADYSRKFIVAFERLRNAALNAGKEVPVPAHAAEMG